MQKIGHFKQSRPLFAAGKIFRSLVSLLVFAAFSARADLTVSQPAKTQPGENLLALATQPLKFSALELELISPVKLAGRAQFLRRGGGKRKSPMSCARLRRPRLGRAASRIVGACPAAPAQAGRDPETPGVVVGVLRRADPAGVVAGHHTCLS